MKNLIVKILSCHHSMPLIMAVISASALGMALMSEHFGGLQPCVLCIYQRWPYAIVIALGLVGLAISFKAKKAVAAIMGFIGVTFFANSVIAFYHTGVELKWWKSFLEGCAVPKMEGNMAEILAQIQSRKDAVRCDEIPWADPILNLSMANWNVIFCLGLAVVAFISARMICNRD